MAVQYILGASGTGKTHYMISRMIEESMRKDHPHILFILPEQSNMAAEQDMVRMHPMGGTMDISILSFTRLAFQVFDKENIYTGDILDDYGKSMLLMKVLKHHEDELKYYGTMIGKEGFIDEVKSVLSEFYQYQITDEVLERLMKEISPDKSLYHKLSDIRLIRQWFEEEMGSTYMVAEKVLSLLSEHVGDSSLLKNAEVYFDGFTGFTPIQYEVIEGMMKVCGNLYFTFTMDEELSGSNDHSEHGIFSMSKEMLERLGMLAGKNQIPVLPHVGFSENRRFSRQGEIHHIERNLFRFPVKEYRGACDEEQASKGVGTEELYIVSADDAEEEIACIGRMIQHYVMEEGYHYRDIAVITGDLSERADLWKQIMNRMHIPYFLDISEPLLHNPLVELVTRIVELFEQDFSYDSVFSFLKTGFCGIDPERIYDLENYALKYGVQGYSWWSKAFKGNQKGLSDINDTRKKFMKCVEKLVPVFSHDKYTASEYIKSLYDFVNRLQLGEKLFKQSVYFREQGDIRQCKTYEQVYDKFLLVLDKTMNILAEEEISRRSFLDVMLAGLSELKLGVIPASLDQVVIGDMERTRLHHIRILFVSGANDGILPKQAGGGTIITDRDRSMLEDMDVALAPNSNRTFYIQQFYLYLQLSQASEHLILSYRRVDDKGNEMNISRFVKWISQMFSRKRTIMAASVLSELAPVSLGDMADSLAEEFCKESFEDSSLYRVLMMRSEAGDQDAYRIIPIIKGYQYMNVPGGLSDAVARRLYGTSMVHSVSRLESYAACEFQFFLRYGLQLEKREEYRVESNHIGTILHGVMEHFFTQVRDGEIGLDLPEDMLLKHVEEITIQEMDKLNDTIFLSSSRMEHQRRVLIRVAKRSVLNLCRHLEQGDMQPAYFEKVFSPEDKLNYISMALSDDTSMSLKGIIDRVDLKETADAVYVKIIDYKSGDKDMDFIKVIQGKQLQLSVYMSVMLELLERTYPGKKIIPTGMYYYHIADQVAEGIDEAEVENNRIKMSRLSGLVNSDDACLEYMDHKTGTVVPVAYKKDGELSSRNSHIVSGEELLAISAYTRKKMIELGENIIHGQITMEPQKGDVSSPCNYCEYRSVCRFEAGLGGNRYGYAPQLKKDEARNIVLGTEKGADSKEDEVTVNNE